MKNKKKDRKTILLLVIALLFMAVGFATYDATLNIGGGASGTGSTATLGASKFEIKYDTTIATPLDESASNITLTGQDAQVTTHSLTDTDFAFAVTLSKPGDKYVATWNVKNFGTIDAVMDAITMSTLTEEQARWLTYTVTYNGTTYSGSQSGLSHALNAGASHTVTLTLEYKTGIAQQYLPTSGASITVNGSLHYVDAA